MSRWRCPITATLTAIVALASTASAAAQTTIPPRTSLPPIAPDVVDSTLTAWYEGFEDAQPSWNNAGGNARYQIVEQQRLQDANESHTGNRCERLRVVGNNGTHAYVSHTVGHPRVIDDLLVSVWIKSDRPGLQVAARVVLPRTTDPRTGQPLATIIHGTTYTNVGRWQQLRIEAIPRALTREVRLLRTQYGPAVDGREAYLDQVLLNVYGGPGATNVSIDDLDLAGYVEASLVSTRPQSPADYQTAAANPAVGQSWRSSDSLGPSSEAPRVGQLSPVNTQTDVSPAATTSPDQLPRLVGSILTLNGRPTFPRIVRHQGEPLAVLQRIGFNTVWLSEPATPQLLSEAAQLGLWLVCPPPHLASPYLPDESVAAIKPLGPQYNVVLAWDLGTGLTRDHLEPVRRRAAQIRAADRYDRPLICLPNHELRAFSRHVDLLLVDRRPLGTSLELSEYGRWVREQPLLARPGTPIWTTVQTQPSGALRQQLRAIEPNREPPSTVPSEQIRLLAYTAITAGSRGLLFESDSRLDADDPETRQRAMSLELLNLELQLIEPWTAAGHLVTNAEGSVPDVLGAVLRTDRARLLLPIWSAPGAQCVPGQSAANGLSLVVPGVPESSTAYQLSPGSLQPLRHKRVTGGTRITLPEFGLTARVVLAHDPLIIDSLTRYAARSSVREAELQRHLAVRKLHTVTNLIQELATRTAATPQSTAWLQTARTSLQWCDARLAAHEYSAANTQACRAMRALRLSERMYWDSAMEKLRSPLASPATASFETLPWHWHLVERIMASRSAGNHLAGGQFEDLRTMLQTGWSNFQTTIDGTQAGADLAADAAHSGRYGLRLWARATDAQNAPAVVETPPVWITSPPVAVEAGQLVAVRGWALVPRPVTGSVDGLLIFDTLAGRDLAVRLGPADAWQPFVLYRVAPQSGQMRVTFALSGLGEARLDDITVEPLIPMTAGNLTQRPYAPQPGYRR